MPVSASIINCAILKMHQSSCHLSHSLRSGPTVNRTHIAANSHGESGFLVRWSHNDASWATFSSWSSGILVTTATPEPSMSLVSFSHYFTPLACIVRQPAVWHCRSPAACETGAKKLNLVQHSTPQSSWGKALHWISFFFYYQPGYLIHTW